MMGEYELDELREQASTSFADYLNLVSVERCNNPSWRKGQTHFNVLFDVRPDLAERVRATNIDPFHRDCKLAEFLSFVRQAW